MFYLDESVRRTDRLDKICYELCVTCVLFISHTYMYMYMFILHVIRKIIIIDILFQI